MKVVNTVKLMFKTAAQSLDQVVLAKGTATATAAASPLTLGTVAGAVAANVDESLVIVKASMLAPPKEEASEEVIEE